MSNEQLLEVIANIENNIANATQGLEQLKGLINTKEVIEPTVEAPVVTEEAPMIEPVVAPINESSPVIEPVVAEIPAVEPIAEAVDANVFNAQPEPVVAETPIVEPTIEPSLAEAAPMIEPVVEQPVESVPAVEPVSEIPEMSPIPETPVVETPAIDPMAVPETPVMNALENDVNAINNIGDSTMAMPTEPAPAVPSELRPMESSAADNTADNTMFQPINFPNEEQSLVA